jgi:hypothetical protein
MLNLRFSIECATIDLPNFSDSNARFRFLNSQADVVAIGEVNFHVVAAKQLRHPVSFQICDWRMTKNQE